MKKVAVRLYANSHFLEPTIVWPEDAVKSKEDEFTFYERVLVNDVEYKIGDCVEMWPDDV